MLAIENQTEYPRCLTLRQKREELGLSQKALAMLLAQHGLGNFGSNFISRFECGLQKPWKGAREALCKVLGMSEEELFPEVFK